MEIKTGKQIHDFFESSLSPDSFSKPPIEFYQNQKWINMDDLLGYLDDIVKWQSPALIHANTIIELIESHSKNFANAKTNSG